MAKNSIIGSNHRGIVIAGTSDVSIYDNVAVNVSGHAFYVGDQSWNNVFEHNLGSQMKRIDFSITLSDEQDYDAAAFFSRFPPNSFVSNVASESMVHGYYFYNSNRMVRTEASVHFDFMMISYRYICLIFTFDCSLELKIVPFLPTHIPVAHSRIM